jgi:hypothetical protein
MYWGKKDWIIEFGSAETASRDGILHLAAFKEAAMVAGYLGHFPDATEHGY